MCLSALSFLKLNGLFKFWNSNLLRFQIKCLLWLPRCCCSLLFLFWHYFAQNIWTPFSFRIWGVFAKSRMIFFPVFHLKLHQNIYVWHYERNDTKKAATNNRNLLVCCVFIELLFAMARIMMKPIFNDACIVIVICRYMWKPIQLFLLFSWGWIWYADDMTTMLMMMRASLHLQRQAIKVIKTESFPPFSLSHSSSIWFDQFL